MGYTLIPTDLTGYGKINSNVYSGNDTANRAIAHGLGITPKFIMLWYNGDNRYCLIFDPNVIQYFPANGGTMSNLAITAPDDTNFYVGNAGSYSISANNSTSTWNWVAIG